MATEMTFLGLKQPPIVFTDVDIFSTSPLLLWQQVSIIFHILTGNCRLVYVIACYYSMSKAENKLYEVQLSAIYCLMSAINTANHGLMY